VREVELSAGTVEYLDTGGDGPTLVFLHGVLMDSSMWRDVVSELEPEFRCVLPTLPLGAHRRPMRPDADLSLRGIARLAAEFIDKLDLHDVTLIGNDWGGAQLLISERRAERLRRLVLCSCEAFDNYPAGRPGQLVVFLGRLPGGLAFALQQLRVRPLRRLPITFGRMSKRPVPREIMDAWLRPATKDRSIRRDLRKYVLSVPPKEVLHEWVERQRAFQGPVLVAWAAEDRVMPREHGRRLAELFPMGQLVEISDSYTLIPEDQPMALARAIQKFVRSTEPAPHGR